MRLLSVLLWLSVAGIYGFGLVARLRFNHYHRQAHGIDGGQADG